MQASQEALKAAKAESARRLKTLQSLQQQGPQGPHLVANAAFLAEKTAREAADSKLGTLRRSLAHKDELIKSLKSKVGTRACRRLFTMVPLFYVPAVMLETHW